jgi:NADH:ubiquinone oxidoreductase subunit 6 (subunit J)
MMLAGLEWHAVFFWLFALLACALALAVLLTSNIVRMAFYLTLSLGAVSGLFFLAGAEFIGAMQLMIYVGGTLVLLVFGVMLTAQGRFIRMTASGGDWLVSLLVGGALLLLLMRSAFMVEAWRVPHPAAGQIELAQSKSTAAIGLALSGIRVDAGPADQSRSGYLLPFVIISVHLLVVLIGAAYLARAKRRVDREISES